MNCPPVEGVSPTVGGKSSGKRTKRSDTSVAYGLVSQYYKDLSRGVGFGDKSGRGFGSSFVEKNSVRRCKFRSQVSRGNPQR